MKRSILPRMELLATLLLIAVPCAFGFGWFVRGKRLAKIPGLGEVWEVANKERKFGSADAYLAIRVLDTEQNERVVFLTHHAFGEALKLAQNNPEDQPPS